MAGMTASHCTMSGNPSPYPLPQGEVACSFLHPALLSTICLASVSPVKLASEVVDRTRSPLPLWEGLGGGGATGSAPGRAVRLLSKMSAFAHAT